MITNSCDNSDCFRPQLDARVQPAGRLLGGVPAAREEAARQPRATALPAPDQETAPGRRQQRIIHLLPHSKVTYVLIFRVASCRTIIHLV